MKNVGCRLSDEEYETLEHLAAKTGLGRGVCLRRLLMGIAFRPIPTEEEVKILEELRKITNALRALTIKAEKDGDPDRLLYHEQYCRLLQECDAIKRLLSQPQIVRVEE